MLQEIKKVNVFLLAVLSVLSHSCGESGVLFNQSKTIQHSTWGEADTLHFEFEIQDTINYYDFSVLVRNTENYQWSNIYLFSDLTFPNGKTRRDTLEVQLADEYGYWLGKNSGTIITTTSTFMQHRKFPVSGSYKVSLTHGMRKPILEEVTDVGLKLKKWEEK
ncbi:MAG: gliding motility lipoprotein GldH [Flavobacteriales bacterium]|nr:gliding motility lipoprotein GldH [Flavobacteriales bacterium]